MISLLTLLGFTLGSPDPLFPNQWSLHNDGSTEINHTVDALHSIKQKSVAGIDIGWLEAKDLIAQKATHPVVVAVIDSGIDPEHPDLKDRIAPGAKDFLDGKEVISDDLGHGTHVSGIIAAQSANGIGISGIAPEAVKVLPLRVLAKKGYSNFIYKNKRFISEYVADAVRYAIAQKVSVINLSLGWPKVVDQENSRRAIQEAIDAGIVVVAAAGNDQKDEPTFPCAYPGVICVGSISNNGSTSNFSNFGGQVDLVAPGDGIDSTIPTGANSDVLLIPGYDRMSGTSQAAPHIAGIAAILKSMNPSMSVNEVTARILAATGTQALKQALYGFPKIKDALEAAPHPIYLPEFKGALSTIVDETSLITRGTIQVKNLWATATSVEAELTSNGKLLGRTHANTLESGQSLDLNWEYALPSLDADSELPVTLRIRDAGGSLVIFQANFVLSRAPLSVKNQEVKTFSENWVAKLNGHSVANVKPLTSYGNVSDSPIYGSILGSDREGTDIEIIAPLEANPVAQVRVPNIRTVEQVLRIDINGDGHPAWLVTGKFQRENETIFQFCFFDSRFQPLWKNGSLWQVSMRSSMGALIDRDYSKPGSWVQAKREKGFGHLIPAFLGVGNLPPIDNFDSLDLRHYAVDNHFYYLEPDSVSTSSLEPVQLRVRVLDHATFRLQHPELHLISFLPGNYEDLREGHVRIFFTQGLGVDAPVSLLDVPSLAEASIAPANGWDALSINGQAVSDPLSGEYSFLNLFDSKSGSVAWAASHGSFGGRTSFQYAPPEDPITGPKGVFDLHEQGKFVFYVSSFHLIASKTLDGKTSQSTVSLKRDSSFSNQVFNDLLTPVMVGSPSHPMPGMYLDSTLIQGDHVSTAVYDSSREGLIKPVRYSFLIPDQCAPLLPLQQKDRANLFQLPLLCTPRSNQTEYRMIQP